MLKDVPHTKKLHKNFPQAAFDGQNGHNCEIFYPTCEHLRQEKESLPVLVSPKQVTAIVYGEPLHLMPQAQAQL